MSTSLAVTQSGHLTVAEDTDRLLVARWLHGRTECTQEAYIRDMRRFMDFVEGKPLAAVTLDDLQAYADSLKEDGLSDGSRKRMLSALKSLFTFAQKTGYLALNVGAALRVPKQERALRIMSEADVHRVIELEPDNRNRVMLRLLYGTGVRVSELRGLQWRDTAERDEGKGQITVTGKGGKVRAILLSVHTWRDLQSLRGDAEDEAPIFKSRKGGSLSREQVFRIVRKAGERAGLQNVSPHWLRHAHVSHALDRGAPIHVVQATVGHSSLTTTSAYAHARPDDSSSLYLGV